jgi:hypothetical protein
VVGELIIPVAGLTGAALLGGLARAVWVLAKTSASKADVATAQAAALKAVGDATAAAEKALAEHVAAQRQERDRLDREVAEDRRRFEERLKADAAAERERCDALARKVDVMEGQVVTKEKLADVLKPLVEEQAHRKRSIEVLGKAVTRMDRKLTALLVAMKIDVRRFEGGGENDTNEG